MNKQNFKFGFQVNKLTNQNIVTLTLTFIKVLYGKWIYPGKNPKISLIEREK